MNDELKQESNSSKTSKQRHSISELFIHRPITTTLVMVGIVLFGLIGYEALPVSDLPTVDFPTIQVNAGLPGASPETMASAVALPLEGRRNRRCHRLGIRAGQAGADIDGRVIDGGQIADWQ